MLETLQWVGRKNRDKQRKTNLIIQGQKGLLYDHEQHDFYNFTSVQKFWESHEIQDYQETN